MLPLRGSRINKTLQQLPVSVQEEVLDFAEFLFEKTYENKNGRISGTGLQKAETIERWAKGHSLDQLETTDDEFEDAMAAFAENSNPVGAYKGTYSREDIYSDHD